MIDDSLFNKTQAATLRGAVDRIIPADEYPSASQAGALECIGRLLRNDLRAEANSFLAGLDKLEAESIAKTGRGFAQLSALEQDEMLDAPPSAFLSLLVRLTGEAFYSDPANGGNRDGVSWKMIGYDPGANSGANSGANWGAIGDANGGPNWPK